MKIAVVPTVFVALGGTGQIVVERLRSRLEHRIGTADVPFFRYLYIDTQQDALTAVKRGSGRAAAWTATNAIDPAASTIARVQNPQLDNGSVAKSLDIDTWFDEHARHHLGSVEYARGVGGRRMYSRLGFLASQNLGALEQTLTAYYNELVVSRNLAGRRVEGIEPPYLNVTPVNVEEGVRFVILASAGGGTGSGSFIDFGFFLRRLRQQQNWQSVYQFGHVAIARPAVDTASQRRNTAGLLTELDHWDGTQTYSANYLTLNASAKFTDRNPPYDAVYIVSATQQDRPLAGDTGGAFESLLWRMAEFAVADAIGVFDDETESQHVRLPRSGPVGAVAFLGDIGLNPRGQQTYGVACREWPAGLVHRRLYNTVIQQLAGAWSRPQPAKAQQTADELRTLLGIPGATAQANKDPRSPAQDRLKDALLAPVNELDPVEQLKGLRGRAYEDGKLIESRLTDVQNSLRQMFQQRTGAPTSGSQPGLAYGVVHTNLATLTNEQSEQSLPRVVADRLLRLCLEREGGPATAAQAADDLHGAVAREMAFVDECLEGLQVNAPQYPKRLEDCWQYANDALLQQILQGKRAVYQQMERWLGRLHRRLVHFAAYINEWAPQVSNDLSALRGDAPPIVMPAAAVQRLETAAVQGINLDLRSLDEDRVDRAGVRRPGLMSEMRALVAQGLPEQDAGGRATLFADGAPKQQGSTDLTYLQQLEAEVFRSIVSGESRANPYREEVLSLLQEEAAREGRDLPHLLAEAAPLLNYNAGEPEYAGQMFAGNPTHVTEVVQPNQNGFPAFQAAQAGGEEWLRQWSGVGPIKRVSAHEKVTPALPTNTVAYYGERCAIRTDLIVGYNIEERRQLFAAAPHPAVSQKSVKLPPNPEAVRRARMLLIGSLAINQEPGVNLWTYLGGPQPYHEFSYRGEDARDRDFDRGFQRDQKFHVSHSFRAAYFALAEAPAVMVELEKRVREYLERHRGAAEKNIHQSYGRIDTAARPGPGQEATDGDLLWLNLYGVHYNAALDALLEFAHHFKIPLRDDKHPYAEEQQAGTTLPGGRVAAQSGWFCRRCAYSFGINRPRYNGECPGCGNPHVDKRSGINQ